MLLAPQSPPDKVGFLIKEDSMEETDNLSQSAPEVDEGQAQTAETEAGIAEETPQSEGEEPQTSPEAPEEDKAEVKFKDLADKKGWKSEDDAAKSYANLEKELTRTKQDISGLKQVDEAMTDKGGSEAQASPDENILNDPNVREFQKTITENAKLEAKKELLEELAPDIASTRVLKAAQQYPDLPKYSEQIVKQFEKYPFLKDSFAGLVDAYKLAKGSAANQEISDAKEVGKQEAYKGQEAKEASKPETASKASGKRKGGGMPSLEEFKSMSPQEKEEIIASLPENISLH